MKFRILALAACAALSCTAQAALFGEVFDPAKFTLVEAADGTTSATYNGNAVDTVLVLSGASASSKTLGTFVIEDNCDKSTLSVLWNDAAGANYRAYACDTKAGNIITGGTGTSGGTVGSLVVFKRDTGGSKQGVDPIYVPTKIAAMQLGAFSTTAAGGVNAANNCVATGNAASLNVPSYTCGSTVSVYPDAGTSDVEPAIILNAINAGSGLSAVGTVTSKSIFQQMIGVGVSLTAYRALQQAQGLTGDDAEANRPSLPSDFVASAVLGKLSTSATGKRGWGLVIPTSVDANVTTKQMNICRRAAGSGTQAAANIYFAGNPCSTGKLAPLIATGSLAVTGSSTYVNEGSSSGAVETCLKAADNAGAYAIGHIGRDNDVLAGTASDKKYRFVKLDGAQPEAHVDATTGQCTGARNFAGCNDGKLGRYSYVFESTMQWNNGTPGNAAKVTLLNNIATKGFSASALQGNSAAVVAGVMALPSSYSGAYENLALASANQVYGSRVSRGTSSCSPLLLAK
jgi:hypothetical protein